MKRRDLALENEERSEGIFNFATGCPICEKKGNSSLSLLEGGKRVWRMETGEITVLFTVFGTLSQKRNGKGAIVEEESFEKESFFVSHL